MFVSIYFVRTHMKSNQDKHKPLVDVQLRNLAQIMHKTFHEDSIKKKVKNTCVEKNLQRKERESR